MVVIPSNPLGQVNEAGPFDHVKNVKTREEWLCL
jgi:hypothetical protein